MLLRLKEISDSLVNATLELKDVKPVVTPVYKPLSPEEAKIFIEKTTTVQEKKSSRNLLGRLKDAIVNKSPRPAETVTTVARINNDSELKGDLTLTALNDLLRKSLNNLTYNYKQLEEHERRLILINDKLLTNLSTILKDLRKLQTDIKTRRDEQLNRNAELSLEKLSNLTKITLILSSVLALVILLNAWQLYKRDKKLVAARNEAIRQTHIRGDILSHMSHEIRTPLNSILGFSEQLEHSALNDLQKEQIAAVRQSSKVLLAIVNDVLDLSKFAAGNVNLHTTNFYPRKTVEHVLSSLQVLASKRKLELICNYEIDERLQLAGDEYRLKQVLINLINNAIKFTQAGQVKVHVKTKGHTLIVAVSDTGRGIAKEHLESIFDEFIQIAKIDGSERQNGSGLGLAICKKIIEAQDGDLNVVSEPGKGSTFTFSIPYKAYQAELEVDVEKKIKPALDIALISTKTILVAEDDKMNIRLISLILNKWGVDFDVVESGRLAFDSFERNSYDMILTDINMPDGDGISLTKMIRGYHDQAKSKVPVLAITANAMQKDLEEYRTHGISDHIVKPFTEQTLFDKIMANLS